MEQQLTIREVEELADAINNAADLPGVKFAYACARTMDALKPALTGVHAAKKKRPSTDAVKQYDEAARKLAHEFAQKDDEGEIVSPAPGQVILRSPEAYSVALQALQQLHPQATEELDAWQQELDQLRDEQTTVNIHQITEEHLPEKITTAQLIGLIKLIKEEPPPCEEL